MSKEKNYQVQKEHLEELISDPKHFEHKHASEIAKILKEIYHNEERDVFISYINSIPKEYLGEILLELPEYIKDDALEDLTAKELAEAVEELDSDDAADLLQDIEEVDESKTQEILEDLDDEDVKNIQKLRKYSEDEAGSLMQTELFSAKLDANIGRSIERLKRLKDDTGLDNIYHVFLEDDFGFLVGYMPLEDVITFDFNKTYRDYMEEKYKRVKSLQDTASIDDLIKSFEDYNIIVLPIVDGDGKLIGRVTYDDIIDIIEERATDQIYKMAGVDEEVEDDRDVATITRKRAVWLGVNLVTAIAASLVIGLFDSTIQSYVALAVLMPIVASMGGNAGTQTLTVMVRQLALEEIKWNEAKDTIIREVLVSLLNGLIFAIVMGAIAYFWFGDIKLGVVMAAAMVINLLFAGLFGSVIPLTLKRLNIDPAVASSVLLTTVTDMVGFFAFLGLAKLILIK